MAIYNKQVCKAFCRFNQTNNAFGDSHGFSSQTDDGNGRQRLNFSTAFGDNLWAGFAATEKNDSNDDHNQLVTIGANKTNRRANSSYIPLTVGRSRHSGYANTAFVYALVFSN